MVFWRHWWRVSDKVGSFSVSLRIRFRIRFDAERYRSLDWLLLAELRAKVGLSGGVSLLVVFTIYCVNSALIKPDLTRTLLQVRLCGLFFARVAPRTLLFYRPLQNRPQWTLAWGVGIFGLLKGRWESRFSALKQIFWLAYIVLRFAWLNFEMLHFHWLFNPQFWLAKL